jgi:hypothetical protein
MGNAMISGTGDATFHRFDLFPAFRIQPAAVQRVKRFDRLSLTIVLLVIL